MTMRTAIPIIQLLTTLVTTVSIAIGGWLLSSFSDLKDMVHAVDNRVTAIEQQQFTIKDSITLNEKILERIAVLDSRMTNILNQPPLWFSEFLKQQEP